MKKFYACFFVLCLLFLVSCGTAMPTVIVEKQPVYDNDRYMEIGLWGEPFPSDENYAAVKDAGINRIFLGTSYGNKQSEAYYKALDLCVKYGMKAVVQTENNTNNKFPAEDPNTYTSESVAAINYWDEPHLVNFGYLKDYAVSHVAKYGVSLDYFVNHYPMWLDDGRDKRFGENYETFIRKFDDEILATVPGRKIISVDVYPMLKRTTGEYLIEPTWLRNLEITSSEARRINAEQHYFIQLIDTEINSHISRRKVDENSIRFQFAVNMAYGVRSFSYFDLSCLKNSNGAFNGLFDCIKTVNHELAAWEKVFLSFTHEETFALTGKGKTRPTEYTKLKEQMEIPSFVDGASENTLIGSFVDEEGRKGYLLTNYSDPSLKADDDVTLTFAKGALSTYINGVKSVINPINGKFNVTVPCGGYAFVIPY